MSGEGTALSARLRAELGDLERVVQRAEYLMSKAIERGDDDYLDGVALNLHGFYAGVERIFEEIANDLDGSVPGGPDWHRGLLLQMSAEVTHIRPPLLKSDTRSCMEEYRAFRHVVRNVYTFNLRPARLQDLVGDLRVCYTSLTRDVMAFCDFLDRLGSEGVQ